MPVDKNTPWPPPTVFWNASSSPPSCQRQAPAGTPSGQENTRTEEAKGGDCLFCRLTSSLMVKFTRVCFSDRLILNSSATESQSVYFSNSGRLRFSGVSEAGGPFLGAWGLLGAEDKVSAY